jgi:ABC-type nitrate/sulfonate/bicarbonate transport system ATPase subunit
MVFQDHNLFPWMTVLDNVAFGLKCRGVPRSEREQRARGLLRLIGLEDVAGAFPSVLSGGMSQRVGFARALAVEPRCVLLDEPFQALDETTKQSLRGDFAELIQRRGLHAVLVTHDLEEAAMLADCVLVMVSPGQCEKIVWDAPALPIDARTRQLRNAVLGVC